MQRVQAPTRVPSAPARRRCRGCRVLAAAVQQRAAEPSRPLLALTGGGIYYFWQVGAVLALRERVQLSGVELSGVSAGALTTVLAACEVDLQSSVDLAYSLTLQADLYNRSGGLAGVWGPLIRRWLLELLPADAAQRCSGRVSLFSLAVWPLPPRRLVTSQFESKEAVVDAAMSSVHIPYFLNGRATARYRGTRCIDGSVAAPRDIVDTRRGASLLDASGQRYSSTLLVDHNADPAIASSRSFGDFVALATREGLQRMVDQGESYMKTELASGRLDAWLEQAAGSSDASSVQQASR